MVVDFLVISRVIGDIDNDALKTLSASAVEQGGLDHQGSLIV